MLKLDENSLNSSSTDTTFTKFSTEQIFDLLSALIPSFLPWVQKRLLSKRRKEEAKEEPPFINQFPRRTDIECVEDLRKRPSTYLSKGAVFIMKGQIFFRVETLLQDFKISLPEGWTPEKVTEKALTENVECLNRLLDIFQALRCVEKGVCDREEFSQIFHFIKENLPGAEWGRGKGSGLVPENAR